MKITEEQELAINAHDVSVAVSAAAGSGKTSVLTKRIIKHVCDDGGKISRILAVTFTEAAAAEILERVSRAISEKLAEDPSNKHIARQSLLVNSAKISTVHTFCYGIVRENFEDIGLPSDISVADAAWLDSQKKKIMLSLADDYLDGKIDGAYKIDDFTLLADTFSEKSNMDNFCKTALNIYEKLSIRAEFIDSLDEYIQMYKNAASGNFKDSFFGKALREIMLSSAQTYACIFDDAVKYAEENDEYAAAVPRFKQSADFAKQLCDFVQNGFDYESAAELLESYKPDDFRGVKPENQSDKYIFFKEKRGDFNKFVNAFKSEFFCFDANDIDYAADYSAKVLEDLKKFLSVFDKRFKAEKIRRHVISFSDMEHYALDILWDRENDAPTKAALSVRESYDEVFIDEYQDTNEVQDKIFSLICKDNNKFCVGDVKQSIYGFRGAAPYIFTNMLDSRPKYEEGITEPSKIFLSKNFRSDDCILNFCNTVFDTLMNVGKKGYGADERLVRGLKNDSDEKASDGEKSADANKVEIGIFDKNGESENEYIAKRITELVRSGYKYSDIAILVRKNKHVEPIANELAKYNIPYVNPDEKEFFKSPEVLLVLSLLSVIDNPAKDVYLAATLKSRIYGVTLDELLRIRAHSDGSLFDALCAYTKDNPHFSSGKRFLSDLEKFRAIAENATCESIIKQVYLHTDIISLVCADCADEYESERRKFNLIQLYNYARGFGGDSYRGLFDFIEFVENVIEGKAEFKTAQLTPSGDSVKIMTVHKSKGLEFKVCFLSRTQSVLIYSPDYTKNLIMCDGMPVVKTVHKSRLGRSTTPFFSIASCKEKIDAVDENLRVLYVALTRAKEKLIITATPSRSGKIDFSENSSMRYDKEYLCPYMLLSYNSFIRLINAAVAGTNVYQGLKSTEEPELSQSISAPPDKFTKTEAKELIEKRLSFEYPQKDISQIPSKMSVSKLYPDLLDDDGGEFAEAEQSDVSEFCAPRFLSEADNQTTAAERGTATHTFMQFFDFDRVEKHGVEAEIKYLAENGFIFMSDMQKIDKKKLEKFFRSDIAKKMRSSKKIYREKRFMLSFPAEEFTLDEALKEKVKNEKLLVQGVIDCAYEDDDGKIVLIDYKTDHFKYGTPRDEIIKTLKERHTRQLIYYKRACEYLFGEVSHVYIYSFALDGIVEI